MKPSWLTKAIGELKVEETPGEKANPRILDYHASTTLHATSDEIAWCAAFVCWCLEKAEIPSPRSARARDFLTWGVRVEKPRQGSIVVLARGPGEETGHVGFYWSEDSDQIYILGGNQSNKVCVKGYYKYNVLGYVEPEADYWEDNIANPICHTGNSRGDSDS